MNRYRSSHPDSERLLQYVDGELSSRNAAQVRFHLEACWRCRAEIGEIQETITDYVRYEQTILTSPPEPPASWNTFEVRLDRLIAERQRTKSKALLPGWRFFAAALAAAALIFAIVELRHPQPVSAAELLQKAAQREAAAPRPVRLRIKARGRTFTRAAIVPSGRAPQDDVETELRSMFVEARYSWEDPLSAASFAAWRKQLPDPHDDVDRDRASYRIRTSTREGNLFEATLNLRAADLAVKSGTFRFRGSDPVEIAALPDEPAAPAQQTVTAPRHMPTASVPAPAEELRALAAIHSAQADLGEQIELNRDSAGHLVVTATGLAPSRRMALRNAVAALPDISLHFQEPQIDLSKPAQAETGQSRAVSPDLADPVLLKLRDALGGATALAQFTGQALEASEAAMVQVHNLRKLAVHFPPTVELPLDPGDRAILAQLRQDYAQALAARVTDLERLLTPALTSAAAPDGPQIEAPSTAPPWQDATETLFSAEQTLDRSLTELLTGAAPAGTLADVQRALKQLRTDTDWYRKLK